MNAWPGIKQWHTHRAGCQVYWLRLPSGWRVLTCTCNVA